VGYRGERKRKRITHRGFSLKLGEARKGPIFRKKELPPLLGMRRREVNLLQKVVKMRCVSLKRKREDVRSRMGEKKFPSTRKGKEKYPLIMRAPY